MRKRSVYLLAAMKIRNQGLYRGRHKTSIGENGYSTCIVLALDRIACDAGLSCDFYTKPMAKAIFDADDDIQPLIDYNDSCESVDEACAALEIMADLVA